MNEGFRVVRVRVVGEVRVRFHVGSCVEFFSHLILKNNGFLKTMGTKESRWRRG